MFIKASKIYQIPVMVSIILTTACTSLPNRQSTVVDDYKMAYAVQGQDSPTVVFESGFGAPMENWSEVFSEVATFSKVFAYNRRGYEGSEFNNEAEASSTLKNVAVTIGELAIDVAAPTLSTALGVASTANAVTEGTEDDGSEKLRTAKQTVKELRALLTQAGLEPPYVLVGHSLGGLYTLYYAKTYPQEVLGVVLVDSSHPEQLSRCRERYSEAECDVPWLMKSMMKVLPDEVLGEFHGIEVSGQQVLAAGPLPPMPLAVLSHGTDNNMGSNPVSEMWPEFQQELAAQLPDSTHIIAEESGHFIQQDQPQLVIEAIKEIIVRGQE